MKRSVYTPYRRKESVEREYIKPFDATPLKTLTPLILVDKATECHVTPEDVADTMASWLDITESCTILEPSAGTGNLVKAVLNHGATISQITMVERHVKLCEQSRNIGEVVNSCFLEYAETTQTRFDRVIMNPPFSCVRKHISAALGLLKQKGVLVALVPVTFEHSEAQLIDVLPYDTFATAKVNTKLIVFNKSL